MQRTRTLAAFIIALVLAFSSCVQSVSAINKKPGANEKSERKKESPLKKATVTPFPTSVPGVILRYDPKSPAIKIDKGSSWRDYLPLAASGLTSVVALFIAFLPVLREWRRRPRLRPYFDPTGKEPYLALLGSNPYKTGIEFDDNCRIELFRPMRNVRVLVWNHGKSTARRVQVRLEKVQVFGGGNKEDEYYYHPSAVKWSGEPGWNPVDIVSDSFFFLDLFFSINETPKEVGRFNHIRLSRQKRITEHVFCKLAKKVDISGDIYWNFWVETPELRGLVPKYKHEGAILADFIGTGENCKPFKFSAEIQWSTIKWNEPTIKVTFNGRDIGPYMEGKRQNDGK